MSFDWAKKKDQLKSICEKTNFADTCQYESDKLPGPGTYNVRTHIAGDKVEKKWTPHEPIQPHEAIAAENGNYNPLPVDYNTFAGYQVNKNASHQIVYKKSPERQDKSKENQLPGPGAYSTVSFWPGKSPPKKNEYNYFNITTKGPSPRVYH